MSLKAICEAVGSMPAMREVLSWGQAERTRLEGEHEPLTVKGAVGSVPSFILHRLQSELAVPVLCITADEEAAAYLASDLSQLPLVDEPPIRFPASGRKPYDVEHLPDPSAVIERADVLQRLAEHRAGLVVTSLEALYELVPPPETIHAETLPLKVGDQMAPADVVELLMGSGFERVEFVAAPGELALRGGILDVFPYSAGFPIRIEFFGDEIDSLREFDPKTQRSVSRLNETRIVPDVEGGLVRGDAFDALFRYLPERAILATFDEAQLSRKLEDAYAQACEEYDRTSTAHPEMHLPRPEERYMDAAALGNSLQRHARLRFGSLTATEGRSVSVDGRPQPRFNSSIKLLDQRLRELKSLGFAAFILCDSRGQEGRIRQLLAPDEDDVLPAELIVESLHEGFELPKQRLAVYTDHQIFNRYHRPTARRQKKRLGGLSLRELQNLTPGDFVVHVDFGIGRFAGLQRIEVRGKHQEAVRVIFAENDVLYVNVNALHKLHRYTGKEGHQPRLTRLGSGQWERTKERTKRRVKDIARDLIRLYAKRKTSGGFAFSSDTVWQRELEASFEFEDTPDQMSATEAVKADMQQPVPMDRLVCGDVGFGKTEVAVRAAFKAVQDGKQVAVLVPTTILARQHADTFNRRLSRFPVAIDSISRFRTTAEQNELVSRLSRGEIDILIGTHRIVSKDVRFKNLGLLIVDEEQRFGVAVKEKLRELRTEVDTLTMTATPIPRTLQFSLLGARDLSIINTPPPNRQPIVSEIHTFDRDLIRDAILYETSRGGQVFFIHNRVQSIDEMATQIRALVPTIRVGVAHGQMQARQLESVMTDFIDRKFDVLVSTNIIESGLDIANANTIIINHAERFGLSDLHQLRGRVGRSDRKAFCYLLVPSIHTLTREARQRIQAVEEFADLGSGFSIAMRDLDIRGAGNMLGAEQSGFIEDLGFETYHTILDEAVRELRADEFSDLFHEEPLPAPSDTVVDVDEDTFIPEDYLSNGVERLNVYRRISEATRRADLDEIHAELEDRFGPASPEVSNLLAAAELKIVATSLRLPRITFKNQRLFLELPDQKDDSHFYEHIFQPLLERLAGLDHRYVLRETSNKRLRIIVQNVTTLVEAKAIVERLVRIEAGERATAT